MEIMNESKSTSLIEILPLGNNVIIKRIKPMSQTTLLLADPRKVQDSYGAAEEELTEVVGVGESVSNINIGDKVILNGYSTKPQVLVVPSNTRTLQNMIDFVQEMKKDNTLDYKSTVKLDTVEYFICSSFEILAIYK